MALKEVLRKNLKEQIYDMLLDEINQHYKAGERLPSIKELCNTFNTSFSSVRDALMMLKDNGIVELRHGAGTYVLDQNKKLDLQDTVCLCMPIHDHLFSDIYKNLSVGLQKLDKVVFGLDTSQPDRLDIIEKAVNTNYLVYVILGNMHFPFSIFKNCDTSEKRFISLIGSAPSLQTLNASRVLIDFEYASGQILQRIINHGHRNVLVAGTNIMLDSAFKRISGIADEERIPMENWPSHNLQIKQLYSNTVESENITFDTSQFLEIMTSENRPTAIIGLRDVEARIAQQMIYQHLPQLIDKTEIWGFGNTPYSQYSNPPFSTVDFNLGSLAEHTIDLIQMYYHNINAQSQRILVKPKLIVR